MIRELHEQIEDEAFDIKFDEFEDLIKFDLFTSKEVALIRVRSLQVSIVGALDQVTPWQIALGHKLANGKWVEEKWQRTRHIE